MDTLLLLLLLIIIKKLIKNINKMEKIWYIFLIQIGGENNSKSSGWYKFKEVTPYIAKALYIESY